MTFVSLLYSPETKHLQLDEVGSESEKRELLRIFPRCHTAD